MIPALYCQLLVVGVIGLVSSQYFDSVRDDNWVRWCTINPEEQRKCEGIANYLNVTVNLNRVTYVGYGSQTESLGLKCVQSYSKAECMVMLDNNLADVTSLDAGEIFIAGRYHSLVPILAEEYSVEGFVGTTEKLYGIAVVKRSLILESLRDLRGRKACFAGVGTLAGWVIPVSKLMKDGGLEVVDCNNHVKSAINFFGPSCAVNSLSDKYNPLGDNSHKLCEICGSDLPGVRCTSNDPYAGYQGALSCLFAQGDIAFVKHSSVLEYFNGRPQSAAGSYPSFTTTTTSSPFRPFFGQDQFTNRGQQPDEVDSGYGSDSMMSQNGVMTLADFKNNYNLLCPNGERRNIEEWRGCNWGELPSHVVVTTSAKTSEMRQRYQSFIQGLAKQYGGQGQYQPVPPPPQQSPQLFPFDGSFGQKPVTVLQPPRLFESYPRYGNRSNLMFSDATVSLRTIPEQEQTYTKYLGETSMKAILDTRFCPIGRVSLCVTSDAEMTKCIKMKTALNDQLLKPEMSCYRGHSQMNCMEAIRNGNADVGVFDAGDVYRAGLVFQLIPVLSEVYNLGEPEFYAVAVAYKGDPDTELTYLKGKRSCHSGIGHAAGWVIPMAYLLSSGRMRSYGCDSVTAASQYFAKSCVPGALSNDYNTWHEHTNLCDLCHGSSFSYCKRDASEGFYGNIGAFRCLVEGGGQVAFVKHTTVTEVSDGKRKETWARNLLSGDYELLCRDGTRSPVTAFERCNIGKVKSNAVVIRGGEVYNETEANAIINLFLYLQQFYGRKIEDDFNFGMFYSPAPYSDLIFQDAAQLLKVVPPDQRHYHRYLGKTFLRNMALVDCTAGQPRSSESLKFLPLVFIPFWILVRKNC